MENSQTANYSNDFPAENVLVQDLTGDYLWKPLYSHSYTLFFNCATCSHLFDIDGWFYQFESIVCPQCRTVYSGVFGKTMPGTIVDAEKPGKNILKLESFDGQAFEIQLSSNNILSKVQLDHIFLIIFSKVNERAEKPWCAVDWSIKNSKAIYLQPLSNTVPVARSQRSTHKTNPLIPILVVGLFLLIGLISAYFYLLPG
jgi:hypothetical protein